MGYFTGPSGSDGGWLAECDLEHVRRWVGQRAFEIALASGLVYVEAPHFANGAVHAVLRDGLATTLRKHVEVLRRVSGQAIELRIGEVPRLSGEAAAQVLRIAQEGLGNAVRHSGARRIKVRLDDRVLVVADDGHGFDRHAVRGRRLGLTSMAERATELGARLDVVSAPGEGTTIRLELPA